MKTLTSLAEFKTIGADGPSYEVLEKGPKTVKIQILVSGEVVTNYPRKDYENDPVVK